MMAPPPAASPFAAPVQTTPQAWGAAGADIPQQLVPGGSLPALPPGGVPQQTYQQPISPQAGTYVPAAPQAMVQPQPTQPPTFAPMPSAAPAPSLKPIPEMPRNGAGPASAPAAVGQTAAPALTPLGGTNGYHQPSGTNGLSTPNGTHGLQPPAAPAQQGMPVLPGDGPKASTNAFPRLLEPTSHTTSWQASPIGFPAARRPGYPTASLPSRLQQ